MLELLCCCTVTTLPGLSSVGPCQAAAWLPVWWHAGDHYCLGTDPLWGGGRVGGDSAAALPGLKLGIPFFFLVLMWTIQWTIHMSGSYHLISQAGWNRCTLLHHYYSNMRLHLLLASPGDVLHQPVRLKRCNTLSLSLSLSSLILRYGGGE